MNQLKSFHIKSTKNTPGVRFDRKARLLALTGVSSPENTIEFYKPVFDLIGSVSKSEEPSLAIDIKFVHFNSSSAKVLFDLLQKVESDFNPTEVKIDWYCDDDDDDMIETAEDFNDMLDINIQILINEEI